MPLAPPVISLADPLQESEGSVDPLSLQRTYERLADRVLPAVTVRMGRIRFVTAMCLGALVCQEYDDDAVASDGVTPPWLVFEWFVIEAFAREQVKGERVPGMLKVQSCLNSQRPVSAAAYLKTPKVFGFSGIFRRLAVSSGILDDQLRLDDGGWEILRSWEREEGLRGLIQGREGDGASLVRELRDAVERGMKDGHTVQRPSSFWGRLAGHLHPSSVGKQEAQAFLRWLRSSGTLTREHLDLLTSHGAFIERTMEADYLRKTAAGCSPELAAHLAAIDSYEALCRPVAQTFDLLRELSTQRNSGPVSVIDLIASQHAEGFIDAIAKGCERIQRDPCLLDWESDVRSLVDAFDRVRTPSDLFEAIVNHHEAAQRAKPPDGKRAWIERARDNSIMIRPAYALPERSEALPYVHDYRTATLCRFLTDAGAIS